MPGLMAAATSALAGWLIDDLLQPYLGAAPTFVLSFTASTVLFFVLRKWLKNLRDGQ